MKVISYFVFFVHLWCYRWGQWVVTSLWVSGKKTRKLNKTKSCIINWNSDWKWEIFFTLFCMHKWNFPARCLSFTSPYDNCDKTTDLIRGSCVTVEKLLADWLSSTLSVCYATCLWYWVIPNTGLVMWLGTHCHKQASIHVKPRIPKQDICHLA